jgi:hypothetical protein
MNDISDSINPANANANATAKAKYIIFSIQIRKLYQFFKITDNSHRGLKSSTYNIYKLCH